MWTETLKKTIGPAFVLAVVLLILVEIGARLFWANNISGRFAYGYDPDSGFVEKGDSVELVRAGGRRFREQTFSRIPAEGTRRIIVIGDSVPRGPGLHEAYAAILPKLYTDAGQPTEGINMAIPGYGCRRAQIVFKRALTYQPDLVILHLNNSNEFEDEREWRRSQEFASWHPRNWFMKVFIFRRLYELRLEKWFWYMLPQEVRLQETVNDADAEISAMADKATVARWNARIAEKIRESIDLARAANIRVLILTQCNNEKAADGSRFLLRNDFLEELAGSVKNPPAVLHLSMYDVFKDAPYQKEFADGAHLRQIGHERLARALKETLEQNGGLGTAPR